MAKGRERSAKWYFQNEKEVMEELGFTVTKGSGNTWIDKEDGHNDYVLAQLKSTDKESYKLNLLDLEKLEYNATVSRKLPMFIIQFLQNDDRYALVKIEDIPKIAEYIKTGETEVHHSDVLEGLHSVLENKPKVKPIKKIKSNKSARDAFYRAKEEEAYNRKYRR